ncbi:MAG: chorismate synthase [Clostridia bacterium]|nr:chorismate synthase [Clostridia bacterium]
MKNTFGQSVAVTLFGESHGSEVGAVLDGLAPGLLIDEDFIRHQLSLRRPEGKISTARVEADEFRIVSGVFEGRTTGTPLCILIPNTNTRSKDYTKGLPRPGHADYTAECKYHGFQDYRGGGHFSGRITAALVAAGAIAILALRQNGILIGTHISRLASIPDRGFGDYVADIEALGDSRFPVLDTKVESVMKRQIEEAASEGDSVGGVLETAVIGLPSGVGEPWFDTVESVLSHALFSIPGVKGVEFGDGFALSDMRGSKANDGLRMENGKVVTVTNHNGGINGGITNGMPVIFRCAVKPTPSIFIEQESVDLEAKQNATLSLQGRHDPAIVHRARVVVDSVTALVLCDLLALRFGTDFPDA